MRVSNKEIAKVLNEMANLLDIKGENEFRIRSYRNAARTISGMTESITRKGGGKKQIQSIPGIGKSLTDKILEISKTGSISQLDELKEQIPGSLMEIMKLEQLGPSRLLAGSCRLLRVLFISTRNYIIFYYLVCIC